jgi:tetratricopeptide (TPR) repeat protein
MRGLLQLYFSLVNQFHCNELAGHVFFHFVKNGTDRASFNSVVTRILNQLMTVAIRRSVSRRAYTSALFAGLVLLHAVPLRAQQVEDWLTSLRKEVAEHNLTAALEIANQRLVTAPEDTDARGWRARTLAWLGHSHEAELEYRTLLVVTPNDPDVLSGLAGVLVSEQRQEEALLLLNQAIAIDPGRVDILEQRGSLLQGMGRTAQARSDFLAVLTRIPNDQKARAELDTLVPAQHHELRIGSDTDMFNYTGAANAETLELISRWNQRWTTSFSGIFYQRFGANAGKFSGNIALRIGRNDSITFGGAGARDQGVIPRGEAFLGYAHGFRLSKTRFFRGLETGFQPHWFWYRDARVLTLTSTAVVYMPRDWNFVIAVTQARSTFSGTGSEWRPSGMAKISIPLRPRITANVLFAVGTENFAEADQIGRFSARTFGGGVKCRLNRRQDIAFYVARQARSQGRTNVSLGVNYGFHF